MPPDDMYRTFNMGIGLIAGTSSASAAEMIRRLRACHVEAVAIGEIVEGDRTVRYV
ncbi:MAG: hypothetical protein EHM13_09895 [Acidobacteria bacterium]|nr:MAG: hypothetical protein EHM13_09895 [Acidobacteriota bacterium]